MEPKKELDVSLIPYEQCAIGTTFDLDQMLKYHSSFETGLLVQQSKNAVQ